MTDHRAVTVALAVWIVFGVPQTSEQSIPSPAFEVASIKPSVNRKNGNFTNVAPGGHRFEATNATLKLLIMTAYGVTVRQVSGGPGWLNSDTYDIEATTDRPTGVPQIYVMLRTLLSDRFKLKLHAETKVLPAYLLTLERRVSGLRESPSEGDPSVQRDGTGNIVFEHVPISQLTWFLSLRLGRDVVDRSELKGRYDFELPASPDLPFRGDTAENQAPADSDSPSIFTALRDKLGLGLRMTKSRVEVLIIDSAERPSPN